MPVPPLLRRTALGLLVAGLVLAATEVGLRMALPVVRDATLPPEMIDAHLRGGAFAWHPDLFWYWPHLPNPGSGVDEHGFRRTRPLARAKPAGVRRVIAFGDSQTYGAGVATDQAWPARAEQALGDGWEVLNAGVSGYRSLHALRLLETRLGDYAPDAVIIDCMPFDSPADGARVDPPAGMVATAQRALWDSRLYWLLRLAVEKVDPQRARWLDQTPPPTPHTPGDPEVRQPGNHDRIAAWGREHGVTVVFMDYPVMTRDGTLNCMTRPGELPAGHAVIPACATLHASRRPPRELFLDNNHLTLLGNELVGAAAATTLREVLGDGR